jgi:hypothetical protein
VARASARVVARAVAVREAMQRTVIIGINIGGSPGDKLWTSQRTSETLKGPIAALGGLSKEKYSTPFFSGLPRGSNSLTIWSLSVSWATYTAAADGAAVARGGVGLGARRTARGEGGGSEGGSGGGGGDHLPQLPVSRHLLLHRRYHAVLDARLHLDQAHLHVRLEFLQSPLLVVDHLL